MTFFWGENTKVFLTDGPEEDRFAEKLCTPARQKAAQWCTYYALPLGPEGARRCLNRGNAGGVLVFLSKFYTVL